MDDSDIRFIDGILGTWKTRIGAALPGYRNHVIRMASFCFASRTCDEGERRKILIAACFHDIGLWTDNTFDYLAPSARTAGEYLREHGLESWSEEIKMMILEHHKLSRYADARFPLVEIFRRCDLIDFSFGLFTFGIPAPKIREIQERYPDSHFHKTLLKLAWAWFRRHPWNPLPMVKW